MLRMASPLRNPVLKKAISESYTEKQLEVFNRVEAKFTNVSKSKIKGQLDAYRVAAHIMTPSEIGAEMHSSSVLGKYLRASGVARPGAKGKLTI
jgi:hypothetical protein